MRVDPSKLRTQLGTWVLVVVAGFSSIAAYSVTSNDVRFTRVLTGSMSPTLNVGDIAIVREVPVREIHANDIVALPMPNDSGLIYIHRLTEVQLVDGIVKVRTKGDHNPFTDPWQLDIQSPTVPKVIGRLPFAALPIDLLNPNNAWLFWVLAIVVAVMSHRRRVEREHKALIVGRNLGEVRVKK